MGRAAGAAVSCAAARDVAPAFRLAGTCNLCGACCTVPHAGEAYTCQHLALEADTTRCRVYAQRVDGMPIVLQAPSGRVVQGVCGKDSLIEARGIVPHLGRGCSLTLEAA